MTLHQQRSAGRSAPGRLDAEAKARGRITYVADVAPPGLVHAAVVRSTYSHARIIDIDASAALGAPGVIGVYTASDVATGNYGRGLRDAPILAREKVRFIGEPVAAVVAETRLQAEAAVALVDVRYEAMEAATTMEAALAEGAPVIHERPWEYPGAVTTPDELPNIVFHKLGGDRDEVDTALAAADFVVDEVYELSSVHQAYLEPWACICLWDEGRLRIWLTNKSPYAARTQLAACLDIEPKLIDFQPTFIGGDFGGKGSPGEAPLASELSRLTGRPVKIVLRYSEDLTATNPRAPMAIRVRVGCDRDGHLLGAHVDALVNAGAYGGFTARAPGPSGVTVGCYRLPAFSSEIRRVYTNTVPRGHMRAPGSPQGCFAFESAIDELARAAGIDPIEMRRRNLLTDGEASAEGGVWEEQRAIETLEAALEAYEEHPAPAGWLRGTGIAVFRHGTTSMASTSLRLVPKEDDCVCVEVPLTETGTGSHSVARQLVAQGLGLDPSKVEVIQVGSDDLPRDAGAGGSRVTASLAFAVDAAVKAWQGRLDNEPVMVDVEETAAGPEVGSYCIQLAQVAVDPETGQLKVLEILTAVDVAAIINPKAHQMQIDGGTLMGYGYACLEDLDESDGQLWAANLGEFKIPSAADAPALRTVLVEGGRGVGTANVKMIGELTNCAPAPAIANAVAEATGCRLRSLPITAERIHAELRAKAGR